MAAMETLPRRPAPELPPQGFDLAPVLGALWHDRYRLLAVVFGTMLVTLAVTFALPRWYRAEAVILPPEESDLLSNMSLAQRALTKFPAFGILTDYYTPADIYKAVLQSRTVQEEIARHFDLQKVYRQRSMEKTLRALKTHVRVRVNPDGTIRIQVEDRDPRRAADIANGFLVELDRYNVEKRNSQARRTREFLERRVTETDSLLRVSEQSLRLYQESRHTVAPTTLQGGDVQAAADLMARKILLEVRLGVLRSYLREDNDQVVQTRTELEQLKGRIAALPALQDELTRRIRDQRIQEQLFLLLTAELEQSRIRETMDTPTVQVLDAAVPPERHHRPRRLTIAVAAGLLALMGSAAWVAWRQGSRASA